MLADFFGEQFGVLVRMPDEERSPEAGTERGLWFRHTHLGAGNFGGVADDEVEHRLFGSQLRHRRQHSEGIASQKNHVAGMPGHARDLGVGHVADWVGSTRVLRDAGVVKIDVMMRERDKWLWRSSPLRR